jgi:hypothetical protein
MRLRYNRSMRPRRVAYAIAFAWSSALMLASSHARAGDPAAAREQVKIGYGLAQEGKCADAIPHFAESLRLDPKAITLINLAQCEEKTGKLADALGHWVEARAKAQAEGNVAIESEAEKRARVLEPKLPKLSIVLAGAAGSAPGAEVVRDGIVLGPASMGVPLPVNPGAHTLVVRAKDREDTTETVTIAEGETKRVELKLGAAKKVVAAPVTSPAAKENETGGTSPLVYLGFGVALVGVGVGSVTGILAIGRGSDAKNACPEGVCKTADDEDAAKGGQTLGTISTIGFIVGGVGAAVGIYGLVWGKPKSSASVAVSVGPTGGGLRGTF